MPEINESVLTATFLYTANLYWLLGIISAIIIVSKKLKMNSEFQQLQDKYWNKKISRKEELHFIHVFEHFFEPRAKYLQSISDDAKNSILEIGSGNGYLSVYLEEKFNDVLVSDLSEEMLKHNPCKNKLKASATDYLWMMTLLILLHVVICCTILMIMTKYRH